MTIIKPHLEINTGCLACTDGRRCVSIATWEQLSVDSGLPASLFCLEFVSEFWFLPLPIMHRQESYFPLGWEGDYKQTQLNNNSDYESSLLRVKVMNYIGCCQNI